MGRGGGGGGVGDAKKGTPRLDLPPPRRKSFPMAAARSPTRPGPNAGEEWLYLATAPPAVSDAPPPAPQAWGGRSLSKGLERSLWTPLAPPVGGSARCLIDPERARSWAVGPGTGAYLPGLEEDIVQVVEATILTRRTALHLGQGPPRGGGNPRPPPHLQAASLFRPSLALEGTGPPSGGIQPPSPRGAVSHPPPASGPLWLLPRAPETQPPPGQGPTAPPPPGGPWHRGRPQLHRRVRSAAFFTSEAGGGGGEGSAMLDNTPPPFVSPDGTGDAVLPCVSRFLVPPSPAPLLPLLRAHSLAPSRRGSPIGSVPLPPYSAELDDASPPESIVLCLRFPPATPAPPIMPSALFREGTEGGGTVACDLRHDGGVPRAQGAGGGGCRTQGAPVPARLPPMPVGRRGLREMEPLWRRLRRAVRAEGLVRSPGDTGKNAGMP